MICFYKLFDLPFTFISTIHLQLPFTYSIQFNIYLFKKISFLKLGQYCMYVCMYLLFKDFIYSERGEGREKERKRNTNVREKDGLVASLLASSMYPNPGMYLGGNSNRWLLILQKQSPTYWATPGRAGQRFKYYLQLGSKYCLMPSIKKKNLKNSLKLRNDLRKFGIPWTMMTCCSVLEEKAERLSFHLPPLSKLKQNIFWIFSSTTTCVVSDPGSC